MIEWAASKVSMTMRRMRGVPRLGGREPQEARGNQARRDRAVGHVVPSPPPDRGGVAQPPDRLIAGDERRDEVPPAPAARLRRGGRGGEVVRGVAGLERQ